MILPWLARLKPLLASDLAKTIGHRKKSVTWIKEYLKIVEKSFIVFSSRSGYEC
jgi:hypothetical protein